MKGEIHINIWRENLDEGIQVSFKQRGVCPDSCTAQHPHSAPRYELEFKTSSGAISFWTTNPVNLALLMAEAAGKIRRTLE